MPVATTQKPIPRNATDATKILDQLEIRTCPHGTEKQRASGISMAGIILI
jgi:hypothetical protein